MQKKKSKKMKPVLTNLSWSQANLEKNVTYCMKQHMDITSPWPVVHKKMWRISWNSIWTLPPLACCVLKCDVLYKTAYGHYLPWPVVHRKYDVLYETAYGHYLSPWRVVHKNVTYCMKQLMDITSPGVLCTVAQGSLPLFSHFFACPLMARTDRRTQKM